MDAIHHFLWYLCSRDGCTTCARERTQPEGWKSPRGLHHRPVTERNCVAVRRGGEQREVNDQSVG